MIPDDTLPVEPWQVREPKLNLDVLAQSESLFALSNGHIGIRGNLDEGEPHGLPGTYLNSFYEVRPLPYAEAGFGYPEAGQTVVDVTNGKILRLLVDDEPFDVRYGKLISHERILDLRAGTLTRDAHWQSPVGKQVRVTSTRLVSLSQRSVVAIEYIVEAVDQFVRVTVQSELVANEEQPVTSGDPRVAAILDNPLEAVQHEGSECGALLMHRTRASALMMAAAMDHEIEVEGRYEISNDAHDDLARVTVICGLRPGQRLRIVKYLAYGWSSQRSRPALRDQASAALHSARYSGWQGLVDAQRKILDDYWDGADVEVEGDPICQQAVRFGLFHLLQASARAEGRGIASKGLTGTGYDGHVFWDTDGFVLPVLTYTLPHAAADAPRSWTSRAPLTPGGRFAVRSVRPTGPPELPHGTSTPTSPWPSSAIGLSPAMTRWRKMLDSRCSSRRRGCGIHSDTTTATACGTWTGSPGLTSTPRSCGTTSSPT
jgi:alpha,alpha-trehalose phosphorylase